MIHDQYIFNKCLFNSAGLAEQAKVLSKYNVAGIIGYKVSFRKNLDNSCIIYGKRGTIKIPTPWLPPQKSYFEVINKSSYYKKFITCEKSVYASQIETIANLFIKNSTSETNSVSINESIEIMKILDKWRASLIKNNV